MTKREFIIDWAKTTTDSYLTSYNMHPKVIEFGNLFYPTESNERKSINNLTSYFRKMVKERLLFEKVSSGLGEDALIEFFGTKVQYSWRINNHKLKNL